jgi:hypothetical protein
MFGSWQTRLNATENNIRILKDFTADKSIKFAELGIRSGVCASVMHGLLRVSMLVCEKGLIIDPLTLLVGAFGLYRAFGMEDTGTNSFLKNQQARLKLKIERGAEATALGAL